MVSICVNLCILFLVFRVFCCEGWEGVVAGGLEKFLELGGGGVERLSGLSEEGKLVLCLATQMLQFYDELGGEVNDVSFAFFCGYGDGGGAKINFFFLWVF